MQEFISLQMQHLYDYYVFLSRILLFNTTFLVSGELLHKYYAKNQKPNAESGVSISSGLLLIISQVVFKQLLFMPMMFWCFTHKWMDIQLGTDMWIQAIVMVSFMQWFTHYLYHNIRLFWCLHVVHHSATEMNFSTALRNSALDIIPMDFLFLLIPLSGVEPVVYYIVYTLFKTWGMFIHVSEDYFTNKEIPILRLLLVTPLYHRVHHASNDVYIDKNYSETLPIWDRLFGTYQKYNEPIIYGVAKNSPKENLQDVHLHEFKRLKTDVQNQDNFLIKCKIIFGKVT
jgi:sterol desaturase/sphingolipid hydroxylase (fatty acid hydroxylase superfamily)